MKLLNWSPDGGSKSGVCGWFIIEIKKLFSVAVLHFKPGTRDAFHSHAFNAVTLWLKGTVEEIKTDGTKTTWKAGMIKYTPRDCFHKVVAGEGGVWALTFRGPWVSTWKELRGNSMVTLGHGRKVLSYSEMMEEQLEPRP